MENGDVTGFVTNCVQNLLNAGFDASAFETAKWAGVACLIAIALSAFAGFTARIWKGASDIEPAVTENQFRWLLYVGALLIALPVVAKVTTDQTGLEFESTDRTFAQEVCREQMQSVAQAAEIGALEAQISELAFEIEQVRTAALNPDTSPIDQPVIATTRLADVVGTPVSIFYRDARESDANAIAAVLRDAGAGVALRDTDLSETSRAKTAISGDTYIISDPRAGDASTAIIDRLREAGVRINGNNTVGNLSGTPVQILLY